MSYVTTDPEALDYAAGKLEGIGTSLAAQNASAAASTTGVAPAAGDEVSALQATQFSTYGNLYQQVSAEATAINQAFVQMLGLSGDSYGTTEAANSAATGAAGLGGFSLLGQLTQFGQFGVVPGALSNGSMIGMFAGNPFIGAASTFAQLNSAAGSAGAGGAAPPPRAQGWAARRWPVRPTSARRRCWPAWAGPRRSAGCRSRRAGASAVSRRRLRFRRRWQGRVGPAPPPRTAHR